MFRDNEKKVMGVLPAIIPSTQLLIIKPLLSLAEKGFFLLKIYLEEEIYIKDFYWPDIVIFSRNVSPRYLDWLDHLLSQKNPYIYDIDDNFFEIPPDSSDFARNVRQLLGQFILERFIRQASLVRTYSKELFNKITTMLAHVERAPIRLGWIGSVSTLEQLTLLKTPLKELIQRGFDFELIIAGARNQPTELDKFLANKIVHVPQYIDADLPALVAKFDIGLMPLKDLPAERGKCGLKALIYMAVGVPTICSPVGEAPLIIVDGQNGFLAKDSAEWIQKLEKLFNDDELRKKLAEEGRNTVQDHYADKKYLNLFKIKIIDLIKS